MADERWAHSLRQSCWRSSSYGIAITSIIDSDLDNLHDNRVGKVGQKSGLTFGRVVTPGLAYTNDCPWPFTLDGAYDGRDLRYNQIAVQSLVVKGPDFCLPGDSGSLVWTATGSSESVAVGILHSRLDNLGNRPGPLGVVSPAMQLEALHNIAFCTGTMPAGGVRFTNGDDDC